MRPERPTRKPPNPGSHQIAADMFARVVADAGGTALMIKLALAIASYGVNCFLTDAVLAEFVLLRIDGRRYHRESVGRARRIMMRLGWLLGGRVMPHHRAINAKVPSPHGTTNKYPNWKAFGLRSPMSRGDRRARRRLQNAILRPTPKASPSSPRSSVPPVSGPASPATVGLMDALLGKMMITPRARAAIPREPVTRAREFDRDSYDRMRAKANEDIARLAELEHAELERKERGPP